MFSSLVHTWSLLSLCFPFLQTVLRLVCFIAGVGYISPVSLRDRKGGTFGASGGASIKPWVVTGQPEPEPPTPTTSYRCSRFREAIACIELCFCMDRQDKTTKELKNDTKYDRDGKRGQARPM